MSDWLFDGDDPNYDGQGKSREEETDSTLRMLGCLMLVGMGVALVMFLTILLWLL